MLKNNLCIFIGFKCCKKLKSIDVKCKRTCRQVSLECFFFFTVILCKKGVSMECIWDPKIFGVYLDVRTCDTFSLFHYLVLG